MGFFAFLMIVTIVFILFSGLIMIILEELERRKIIEL